MLNLSTVLDDSRLFEVVAAYERAFARVRAFLEAGRSKDVEVTL
jgi:7,8-dihydro-6-hydroxymethylpterin-pyrophosphokinase